MKLTDISKEELETMNYDDIAYVILNTEKKLEQLEKQSEDTGKDLKNIGEDFNVGNVGTPGRIAKCWVGADTNDDSEIGSGRFMKPIRIASFPNNNAYSKIPITKRVNISANCSHHFLPFNTAFDENSYAIISYVPKENVLGISKLQRLADYVSRRFWLQEDLTKELYKKISEAAQTKDVYVGLFNIKHTCEWLRGAKNAEGGFTSEYYSGVFEDAELRKQVTRT